jgi:hypothetical protein
MKKNNRELKTAINLRSIFSEDISKRYKNVLFRTGTLMYLSEKDIQLLKDYFNIKSFLDLRSRSEIFENSIAKYLTNHGISYFSVAIEANELGFKQKLFPAEIDYVTYYWVLIDQIATALKRLIELVNNFQYPLMFGCYAGKDRTGLLAALILKILNYDNTFIATEYSRSYYSLLKKIDIFREHWEKRGITKDEYSFRLSSNKNIMYHFLVEFDAKYDDILTFLKEKEIYKSDIENFKRVLSKRSFTDNTL